MLAFYQKKYGVLEDHLYAILRALGYFEDAEKESDMPKMLTHKKTTDLKRSFSRKSHLLTLTFDPL